MVAEVPSALNLLVLPPMGWVMAGLWGALWGSFFNVAIYRVGIYESVVRPRSRCPGCGRFIAWYDNIPMLSWLLLRARCRHCHQPISARYPLVELAACAFALLIYWRYVAIPNGDALMGLARFQVYFAFIGCLLVLSGIDFDHQLLPNIITYPAIPIGFVVGLILRDVRPLDLLIGLFAGYAVIAIVAELGRLAFKREAMGYGDAKLLAMIGALLGWQAVLFTFFVAPFLALAVVVPPRLVRGKQWRGEIPYGPFLAAAAAIWIIFPPRSWPGTLRLLAP